MATLGKLFTDTKTGRRTISRDYKLCVKFEQYWFSASDVWTLTHIYNTEAFNIQVFVDNVMVIPEEVVVEELDTIVIHFSEPLTGFCNVLFYTNENCDCDVALNPTPTPTPTVTPTMTVTPVASITPTVTPTMTVTPTVTPTTTVTPTVTATQTQTVTPTVTPSTPSSTISVGLGSWWTMNEGAGLTRVDSASTNDLPDSGTTSQVAGKVGNAAGMSSTHFSIPVAGTELAGPDAFSVAGWVYFDSLATESKYIICRAKSALASNADIDWQLIHSISSGRLTMAITSGSSFYFANADTLGAPALDTWYFVYAYYDPNTGTAGISVDDGTVDIGTSIPTMNSGGDTFNVGWLGAVAPRYFTGRIDELGYWNRILDAEDVSFLYNGGVGVTFADLPPAPTPTVTPTYTTTPTLTPTMTVTPTVTPSTLPALSYYSLAEAESSGDTWVENDNITIIGGPVFIYKSNLAVSGYSGLIHKSPYATGGDVTAVNMIGSTAEGTDPDTWGWTDASSGTKGVDYDFDTSGGLSRLIDLTQSGRVRLSNGTAPGPATLESFRIIDKVSYVTSTTVFGASCSMDLWAYKDGVDAKKIGLYANGTGGSQTWSLDRGKFTLPVSEHTAVSTLDEHRVWLYLTDTNWSLWFDDDPTPALSGTDPGQWVSSGIDIADHDVGYSTDSATHELTHGAQMIGQMTTV